MEHGWEFYGTGIFPPPSVPYDTYVVPDYIKGGAHVGNRAFFTAAPRVPVNSTHLTGINRINHSFHHSKSYQTSSTLIFPII